MCFVEVEIRRAVLKNIAKGTADPGIGCFNQSAYSANFAYFLYSTYSLALDVYTTIYLYVLTE